MTERGVFCEECLARASMTKTAQFADISQSTVSEVIVVWNSEGKTSLAKGNSSQKRILQDRDIRALI